MGEPNTGASRPSQNDVGTRVAALLQNNHLFNEILAELKLTGPPNQETYGRVMRSVREQLSGIPEGSAQARKLREVLTLTELALAYPLPSLGLNVHEGDGRNRELPESYL